MFLVLKMCNNSFFVLLCIAILVNTKISGIRTKKIKSPFLNTVLWTINLEFYI